MQGYTDFEGLNYYNSRRSVAGVVQDDVNTLYFMRSLYQRAISGTRFKLPKSWRWAKKYFKNILYTIGYIGVIKSANYGVIPQICTLNGYGLYLQPTNLIVNQPLCQFDGVIGENCDVIVLSDYMGIMDIVEHYAIRLSTAIASLDVSLINERLAIMAAAKNKSAAETLKVLYEKLSAGEPFICFDKVLKGEGLDGESDPIWTFTQDVGQNYISDKILADMRSIIEDFDREIGIAAVGEKRERMLTDEVNLMQEDACARSSTWFESLSDSFDRVIDLFPELKDEFSFSMRYGGEDYEYNYKANTDRNNRALSDTI